MFVGPSLEFYPDQNQSIGLIGVRNNNIESFETINQLGTDRTKDVKTTVNIDYKKWTTGRNYMENIPLGSAGGGNYWYLTKGGKIISKPKMQ